LALLPILIIDYGYVLHFFYFSAFILINYFTSTIQYSL